MTKVRAMLIALLITISIVLVGWFFYAGIDLVIETVGQKYATIGFLFMLFWTLLSFCIYDVNKPRKETPYTGSTPSAGPP